MRLVSKPINGFKVCSHCGENKPLNDYYPDERKRRKPGSVRSTCKSCDGKKSRAWAMRHPEYVAYRMRFCRLHHYGMTPAQFDELLATQHGRCASCGTDKPGGHHNQWHVDHDHSCCPGKNSCGKCVRGLLCRACNQALGLLNDDPAKIRNLANYIERTTH